MPIYFGYDSGIFLVILAAILGFVAQNAVQNTYRKFSRQASRAGITAAQAAQIVLQSQGVYDVSIGRVRGTLTDHYDPRSKTLRLSEGVYDSTSIAALGIAAHEAGHAVQYAVGYAPIKLRMAIIPVTNLGSKLSPFLILGGLLLSLYPLAMLGVLAFGLSTLFQLITLPVEFNASSRAVQTLETTGATDEEIRGAKKVLRAAAMTYVAALAVSLANLLRLFLLVNRRNRR